MNSGTIWILGILISIILSLIVYLFKENIAVLKALKSAVESMVVKIAVHEQSEKAIFKDIDSHNTRLCNVEEQQVELKLKVNMHETILNKYKDGTYN